MVWPESGGDEMVAVDHEALASWVEASCERQCLPSKITDSRTIAQVTTLLGGKPGGPERGASTVGAPGARSEAPHGVDSIGIESGRSRRTREHGGVIQHGGDNGHLAGEIERAPLSA